MANTNVDPFKGWEQTPLSASTILGYIKKTPQMSKLLGSKVGGKDFLSVLLAVIQQESQFLQYVKAKEYETSYGLFQINWNVHREEEKLFEMFPQFLPYKGIHARDMSESDYENFLKEITNLDFQFKYSAFLMDRNADGKADLSDWKAYTTGAYSIYLSENATRASEVSNMDDRLLLEAANNHSSVWQYEETPPDLADTAMDTSADTLPHDQWKAIKKYYGRDKYDLLTDTWVDGYQTSPEFTNYWVAFGNGAFLNREDPGNTTLENYYEISNNDQGGQFAQQWEIVSRQDNFANPFALSNLTAPPTTADIVMASVFERYVRSAQNQGFSPSMSQWVALSHLANAEAIDRMRGLVSTYEGQGYDMNGIIDQVAGSIKYYQAEDKEIKEWTFRVPSYEGTREQEISGMNERIGEVVRRKLWDTYPHLVDDIRNAWTDYRIVNPNTEVSLEDFAMPFIKDMPKYNQIYRNKPQGMTEEQYIAPFIQAVGSVVGQGTTGYSNMVTSSASVGGTQKEAQTAALGGTAEAGLGDIFLDKVSNFGTRVKGMFRDA